MCAFCRQNPMQLGVHLGPLISMDVGILNFAKLTNHAYVVIRMRWEA